MLASVLITCLLGSTRQAPTWHDIVQTNFKDSSFTGKAVAANPRELKVISPDFATAYRFISSDVFTQIKEPFMVRMEARVKGADVLFIENGARRKFRIPRLHLAKTNDVSTAPGKRQTPLDVGILTPSMFDELYDAKFIRQDNSGELVFDLTYQSPRYKDTTRQRVWVDGQKRYTIRREWFAQDGHLRALFFYDDPKLQNGVWFPSKVTVKNSEGSVAGVIAYTNVIINSGLSDQLFKF